MAGSGDRVVIPSVGTRFLTTREEIMEEFKRLYLSSKELSICAVYSGLVESRNRLGEVYLELAERIRKGEHRGIRFITSIDQGDQAYLVETLSSLGLKVRHTRNFPSLSFTIVDEDSNDGDHAGATVLVGLWHNLVVSNEAAFVRHFRTIFEDEWTNGEDAGRRIDEVRSESGPTVLQVIGNFDEVAQRMRELLAIGTNHEVLVLLPTPGALLRYLEAGVLQYPGGGEKPLEVRVLVPSGAGYDQAIVQELKSKSTTNLELRSMDQALTTRITMFIIDRHYSFIIETREKEGDDHHLGAEGNERRVQGLPGVTTCADGRSIADSYATIFDTLWKQAETFENLRAHERSQSEFINIAAHELRTPVQAIITAVELAGLEGTFGQMIKRNALRLQTLTQDLLDAQKIDRNDLQLERDAFDLKKLIMEITRDKELTLRNDGRDVKIVSDLGQAEDEGKPVIVDADREKIARVISNFLSNAIEFTDEGGGGTITLRLRAEREDEGGEKETGQQLTWPT